VWHSTSKSTRGRVLVLASINTDRSLYVDTLPAPGETVLARSGNVGLGGKGANQAIAAARLGADVAVIGSVGDDESGRIALAELKREGLSTTLIARSATEQTGTAHILVASDGQNSITVLSGANTALDGAVVDDLFARNAAELSFAVGLAQGESAGSAIDRFALHCQDVGARFVLNLAPVIRVDRETLASADPLIVNEGEAVDLASGILGREVPAQLDVDGAMSLAAELAGTVSRSLVITLGGDGAVAATDRDVWHQPALAPERVEDTTGAGDAFVGAIVAALAESRSMRSAVALGVTVGSHSVAHRGTTASYPTIERLGAIALPTQSQPVAGS